jgi:hypothetical protein
MLLNFYDPGDAVGIVLVPVSRIICATVEIFVSIPIRLSRGKVLDHTTGINEIVAPVLIAIAVRIPGGDQFSIRKKIVEIDLLPRDLVGVCIDRHEVFAAAAACQHDAQKGRPYDLVSSHIKISGSC